MIQFKDLAVGQQFRFVSGMWIWVKTKEDCCVRVGGWAHQVGNCKPDVEVKVMKYRFAPKIKKTFGSLEIGDKFYFMGGSVLRIKTTNTMYRWESVVIHRNHSAPGVEVKTPLILGEGK